MGPEQTAPWSWIISTLLVRFIAVFVVLSILGVGIWLSTKVVSRLSAGDGK